MAPARQFLPRRPSSVRRPEIAVRQGRIGVRRGGRGNPLPRHPRRPRPRPGSIHRPEALELRRRRQRPGHPFARRGAPLFRQLRGPRLLPLDAGAGTLLWKHDTRRPVVSTPAVARGKVLVAAAATTSSRSMRRPAFRPGPATSGSPGELTVHGAVAYVACRTPPGSTPSTSTPEGPSGRPTCTAGPGAGQPSPLTACSCERRPVRNTSWATRRRPRPREGHGPGRLARGRVARRDRYLRLHGAARGRSRAGLLRRAGRKGPRLQRVAGGRQPWYGYRHWVAGTNVSLIVLGLIQRRRFRLEPALSFVPLMRAPPNGCWPTTAPVGLSLM